LDGFEELEAVAAGHFDVEEKEVWGLVLVQGFGLGGAIGLAEDVDLGAGFSEDSGEFAVVVGFVVDEEGSDHWFCLSHG
jgi:hypothetical protein